ncbi:uncharacterized protein LOC107493612 [Arachis duranensis]|uniref:Uncharacterized protein LOC107493612 n=1 Tax=Arachis duranensis TaxID=130453 RepID=A0A6P4DW71_ARADU|nr:uncharacterized protein LOC107493612 [Arachis duranensis]
MAAPRRVTIKEAGAPDYVLQPFHVTHPNLNANFELKTALINLLPKIHGLPAQDPIQHLKDFHRICSTTRREGSDEVAIWLFAFPFSLEDKAKEWFYTLSSEVTSDWDLLRRGFLDKFLPPEKMDRLRKEMSCIVHGETEPLYKYWERFRKLLDACPNHMIDTQVLLGYICQGMREQDRTLLDTSSNGSLSKYKTAEEAWQLIIDFAESNQHMSRRVNRPKTMNEVSTSSETTALTKSLSEMTSILRQLQLSQQQPQQPQPYQQPPPPQQYNQQLVPQRVCGICSCYSHYTDECPSLQEDNTLAATHNFYDRPNKRYYQGGQKELQSTLASGLTGLTSTLQALLARMDPPSNPTPKLPTQSGIPSQPQPNPKGGINAITLRSGTQLKEKGAKDSNPIPTAQGEEGIDIEEVVEEETPQVIVENEEAQPTKETPKTKRTLEEEIAQPLPFPTLAKKAKKRIELDPKMIEMFKKVEVTIPLFDAIHQVSRYAKFLKDLCMNKDKILELETIPLGSSISALMGALPEKCDDPGPCMVTCTVNGARSLDCMCDLGACVSIMPLSVYQVLKLPPLKRSAARFVLADKSIITIAGVVEDVLVNIKGLVFPIDFYVLEMPSNEPERASSILLGRPFFRTSRFKLDAYLGTYSFEIDGRIMSFSLEKQ